MKATMRYAFDAFGANVQCFFFLCLWSPVNFFSFLIAMSINSNDGQSGDSG